MSHLLNLPVCVGCTAFYIEEHIDGSGSWMRQLGSQYHNSNHLLVLN